MPDGTKLKDIVGIQGKPYLEGPTLEVWLEIWSKEEMKVSEEPHAKGSFGDWLQGKSQKQLANYRESSRLESQDNSWQGAKVW